MKEKISFYENWYNSFPFSKKINLIIYDNFLKIKAVKDKTYFTRFISSFYLSKADFYVKRFVLKVKKLETTLNISEKAIRTHLLFESKFLVLHCLDLMPDGTDERFYHDEVILKDLSVIKYFKNLEIINFYGQDIFDLAELSNFQNLKELTLWSNIKNPSDEVKLTFIKTINNLDQLVYLNLSGNFIADFREIENSTIEYLELNNTNLLSIKDLSSITNLKFLSIEDTKIESLNGIEIFKSLEILCLGNNEISDYGPILNLPNLKLVLDNNYNEEKRDYIKSEFCKLKPKRETLIFKIENRYALGFNKDITGSIIQGIQKGMYELTRK